MPQALRRGLLLFIGALVFVPRSHGGADYLVVERADRLVIYNKYQQEASPQDRRVLVSYVPMRIVKEDDLLSDGYTRCMQVEAGDNTFYLLKDQNARLTYSGNPGYEQTFAHVTPAGDTVQILSGHPFSFSPINAARQHSLRAGDKVIRVFLRHAVAYCQTLDGLPAYGWVDFNGSREGKDWKVFASAAPGVTVIPDQVVRKIRTRVDEANNVFAKLFDRFNSETHEKRQPPRWTLEVSGASVVCVLEDAATPDDYQQSTLYLAKDIENFTLGADLLVARSPGRIEVTTKGERESKAR